MYFFIPLKINDIRLNKINKKKHFFKIESVYRIYKKNYFAKSRILFSEPIISYFKCGKILRTKETRVISYYYLCFFLSALGGIETLYLTISKLNGSFILCSDQNCSLVLSSVFSYFFGIPVSFFGLMLYFLAGTQLFNLLKNLHAGKEIARSSETILNILPLSLGLFSSYFIYILESILKTACPWCFFSIFLSGSILTFTTIIGAGDKNLKIRQFLVFFLLLVVHSYNYTCIKYY